MTAGSSPAISSSRRPSKARSAIHRSSSPRPSKARSSSARLKGAGWRRAGSSTAGSSGPSSRAGSSGPSSRLSPSRSRCCRRTWSRSGRRMSLVTTETRGSNRRSSPLRNRRSSPHRNRRSSRHRNRRHARSSLNPGRHRDRRALTGRRSVRLPAHRGRLRPPGSGLPPPLERPRRDRLRLERPCQGRLRQGLLRRGRPRQGRPDRCRSGPLASGPGRTGPCALDLDRSTPQVRPEPARRRRRTRCGHGRPDSRASARPRT